MRVNYFVFFYFYELSYIIKLSVICGSSYSQILNGLFGYYTLRIIVIFLERKTLEEII